MLSIQNIHNNGINGPSDTPELDAVLDEIDRKVEKHSQGALPILSGQMSAYDAFVNGSEKAIASYLKLGQEGHVTQKVVMGPYKKSQATADAELLVKALLHNFDSVKFTKLRGYWFNFVQWVARTAYP